MIPLVVMPVVMAVTVFWATRNERKTYQSGAMIYTGLASGYNIESTGAERFDNYAVNSAFDNFLNVAKSRNTLEQVGLELLAQHLIAQKEERVPMNQKDWEAFQVDFPPEKAASFLKFDEVDSVTAALRDSLMSPTGLFYKKLLHTSESYYSVKTLRSIAVKRLGAGDMVEISYQAHDARVCQKTLSIYLETVLDRYKHLKKSETGNAVKYFEEQLRLAFLKLSEDEAEIKEFRESNKIINYQEQTRYIAEKQEDIEDEYYKEIMAQRAAESAASELEEKLKISEKLSEKSDEILAIKQELSTITTKISLLEIGDPSNESIADLRQRASDLTKKIKAAIIDKYGLSHSIEGVPISILLNQWLDYIIEVDKAKARVEQFGEKRASMEKKYDRFAPLGSQLSKLERKVNVSEEAYLEVLHGLNQAKIKEQSVTMKANLKIVDEPSMPLDPMASKRKLLVVAAFLAGLVLVLGFAFITEFLNNGIRSAEGAESITGLPVAGALPNVNHASIAKFPEILSRSINFTAISIESAVNNELPAKVAVISTEKEEGKTKAIELLNEHWSKVPDAPQIELIECGSHRADDFTIKALLDCEAVLWVIKANQSWGNEQKRMLDLLQKAGIEKIQVLINGMSNFWLDSLIGELPIKRSKLRTLGKRMARMEFSKQDVFGASKKTKQK